MTGRDFWTPRRLGAAVGGAILTALAIGLPTVVIPNSLFGRAVPVTWWSYPVLATAALLSGLLLATYVADPRPAGADSGPGPDPVEDRSGSRRGAAAAALSFFAVGCPVCNKLVLLALGSSGALTWFAPAQPVLALSVHRRPGVGAQGADGQPSLLQRRRASPLPSDDVRVPTSSTAAGPRP